MIKHGKFNRDIRYTETVENILAVCIDAVGEISTTEFCYGMHTHKRQQRNFKK
jgi:hypothetical protein